MTDLNSTKMLRLLMHKVLKIIDVLEETIEII